MSTKSYRPPSPLIFSSAAAPSGAASATHPNARRRRHTSALTTASSSTINTRAGTCQPGTRCFPAAAGRPALAPPEPARPRSTSCAGNPPSSDSGIPFVISVMDEIGEGGHGELGVVGPPRERRVRQIPCGIVRRDGDGRTRDVAAIGAGGGDVGGTKNESVSAREGARGRGRGGGNIVVDVVVGPPKCCRTSNILGLISGDFDQHWSMSSQS
jgi:hypothetical protein